MSTRARRVAHEIQKCLAESIPVELMHTDIGFVTVSEVRVSPDLQYAKVFVTFLDRDNDDDRKEGIAVLKQYAPLLRKALGRSLRLRVVPALTFEFDETIERGQHIMSLIESTKDDTDPNNQSS